MPTPSQASLPSQGTTLIPSVSCQTPGRIGPDPCREDPARLPPRYYCRHCLPADSTLDRVIGATDYTNPLDRVFGALKFGQQLALARPLAEVLLHRLAQDDMLRTLARFDALVPVPLSGARLAERGFNQSLEIALALRSASPIPLPPLRNDWLQRIRHTRSQSSLDARTRHQNLRGAFRAAAGLHGKRLALIDDVMTTGSTLIEAARELKAAGAAEVIALVVARTPVPFEAR
ncbi:MAG: ComF family protein [Lautropia sp.]|nr:ComF family protein [Lautropia sp.]